MIILHPPIQCILGDRIVTCDAGTSYLFSSFEMNSYRVLFSSANNILQNLLVTIFIYVTALLPFHKKQLLYLDRTKKVYYWRNNSKLAIEL
jgi:hypothetical protein